MHDHRTQLIDTDPKFEIDVISRKIINNSGKTTLMRYDHNSERLGFSMPRFIDSHDMSNVDRIEIHFVNTDVVTSEESTDKYIVDDLAVDAKNTEKITFSWEIQNTATKYKGSLAFLIRFLCFDGDSIDYSWSTEPFRTLTVGEGFDFGEQFTENRIDQLEAWKTDIVKMLTSHQNDENEEIAHVRLKWRRAIEILFEALSTSAENTKNDISAGGFAVGYNNTVNKCSLAVGLLNVINGYRSFGAGQGLNCYGESNRAYVGQFNAKNGQAVFVVGWGSSDSDRKNIFTVDKVGNGVFAGDVRANGQKLVGSLDLEALRSSFGTQIKELFERVTFCEQGFDLEVERVDSLETTLSGLYDQIGQFNGILDTQQMQIANLQDEIANLKNK